MPTSPAHDRASDGRARRRPPRGAQETGCRYAVGAAIVIASVLAGAGAGATAPSPADRGREPPPVHRVVAPLATYFVGETTCTFVDPSRDVLDYASTPPRPWSSVRRLVTEIRYPTREPPKGAAPTTARAPAARIPAGFPMIVFAHGYNVDPAIYAPLLDAWVRAGFVVAAPVFPDENPTEVAAQHGANTEGDLANEPADIAFVTHAILADVKTASAACGVVHRLIDPSELALAGHSDGATVVGMLSFAHGLDPQGVTYQSLRAALDFKATIVMSGEVDGVDPYGPLRPTPALLVIQSAGDQCNPARNSIELYNDVSDLDKWFLALKAGHHLPPFDGADVADFNVVTATSIDFLRVAVTATAPVPGLVRLGDAQPAVATMVQGGGAPPMPGTYAGPQLCGLN